MASATVKASGKRAARGWNEMTHETGGVSAGIGAFVALLVGATIATILLGMWPGLVPGLHPCTLGAYPRCEGLDATTEIEVYARKK